MLLAATSIALFLFAFLYYVLVSIFTPASAKPCMMRGVKYDIRIVRRVWDDRIGSWIDDKTIYSTIYERK